MDVRRSLYLILVRLNQGSKMFFFAMIIMSNLVFFIFWAFKMYSEMRSMLILKIKFVYLFFCLCGNQRKYELLQQEVIKMEENEILREDFIRSIKKVKNLHSSGKLVLDKYSLEKIQLMLQPERILNLVGQTHQLPIEEKRKLHKREMRRKIGIQQRKLMKKERKGQNLKDVEVKQTAERLVKTAGTIVGFDESMIESREEEKGFFQRPQSIHGDEEDIGFEALVSEQDSIKNYRLGGESGFGGDILKIQHLSRKQEKIQTQPIFSGIQTVNINDLNEETLPMNAIVVVPKSKKKQTQTGKSSKGKHFAHQVSAIQSSTFIDQKYKRVKSRRQRKGQTSTDQIQIHSDDKYFKQAGQLLTGAFSPEKEEANNMDEQLSSSKEIFQSNSLSLMMKDTFGVEQLKQDDNIAIEDRKKSNNLEMSMNENDEAMLEAGLKIQKIFEQNEFNY